MNTELIDGELFARMLSGGAAVLSAHASELNAMNVFPVSDGDTGTNMTKTMEGGLSSVGSGTVCESIGEVSGRFAEGTLLGARGNSGVILSQIFAGINEVLSGLSRADLSQFAAAYRHGIETAYAAVQNPAEGTILTVFRESTEYAVSRMEDCSGLEDFFRFHIDEAKRSLASTKEMLPVLKESDVVDSGANGYLYIAEGMYEALCGTLNEVPDEVKDSENVIHIERFTRDSILEYGYCTEYLLRLTTLKTDIENFDLKTIREELACMGGESVVAYQQGDIVKVHVHTFTPGRILDRMQNYGEFLTVKVENMMLEHTETECKKEQADKPYSVVAAASGDGMADLFSDLGADQVIREENPSTNDFLEAFRLCGSGNILVFPNHKNSFLAAQQAAKLIQGKDIRIIETANDVQGYSALSVLTPGIRDMDALECSARRAAEDVIDGEVTAAIRDAVIDGLSIHRGDYIARCRGKFAAVAQTPEDAVLRMLESGDAEDCELLTVFKGRSVSGERCDALADQLRKLFPECEITVCEGGQDIYDYYLALE